MENNTQRKAVIYCRVSTKEQAEEGNSLATQERNCREYAEKNGYEITQVFVEQGESAKTAERTELQKLLNFCYKNKKVITAVIIYKIDRLSRNTDDYSQLRILLKSYGVEIKSTSEYFENTPAGRFMENIIANVAQFDNDVRTERSVGGMRDAVREGRYVWTAPVGYSNQKVDGKSTIIPNENSDVVKNVFEMVAEGVHSANEIYKIVSSMGLRTRSGKRITKSSFYRMLKTELYMGWICKFGEKHKGKFKPIVSEELFARVQYVMRNKKTSGIYRKENPDFPLRRFVLDPQKHKLTGSWSKGRNNHYAYYRFAEPKLYWSKEHLERLFHAFMDEFAFDKNLLLWLKEEMWERFSGKSKDIEKDFEALSDRKKELKDKQNVLLQKNITGIISDALLKDQLASLDEEIWEIDRNLLRKEDKKVDVKKIFDFISEFLLQPSLTWRNMPSYIKLKLQWFQFPEGVIFDGKKFRTTKISSLFKLKQFFLNDTSFNVHSERLNYEHRNSAKIPALQFNKNVVWEDIEEELRALEAIIHASEPSEEEFRIAA